MKKISLAVLVALLALVISSEAEAQICNPKNCDLDLCKLICGEQASATTVSNEKACCILPNCCIPATTTATEAKARTVAIKGVAEEKTSCCEVVANCCVPKKEQSL